MPSKLDLQIEQQALPLQPKIETSLSTMDHTHSYANQASWQSPTQQSTPYLEESQSVSASYAGPDQNTHLSLGSQPFSYDQSSISGQDLDPFDSHGYGGPDYNFQNSLGNQPFSYNQVSMSGQDLDQLDSNIYSWSDQNFQDSLGNQMMSDNQFMMSGQSLAPGQSFSSHLGNTGDPSSSVSYEGYDSNPMTTSQPPLVSQPPLFNSPYLQQEALQHGLLGQQNNLGNYLSVAHNTQPHVDFQDPMGCPSDQIDSNGWSMNSLAAPQLSPASQPATFDHFHNYQQPEVLKFDVPIQHNAHLTCPFAAPNALKLLPQAQAQANPYNKGQAVYPGTLVPIHWVWQNKYRHPRFSPEAWDWMTQQMRDRFEAYRIHNLARQTNPELPMHIKEWAWARVIARGQATFGIGFPKYPQSSFRAIWNRYETKYRFINKEGLWGEEHWDFVTHILDMSHQKDKCKLPNARLLEVERAAQAQFGLAWIYPFQELQAKYATEWIEY